MNTLVEKMFGIIMFLAIFVPFQLGLYSSYMDAWEFTQVTTEFTQLVKEEGGFKGRAKVFYEGSDANKADGLLEQGYDIQITYKDKATGVVKTAITNKSGWTTTKPKTNNAGKYNEFKGELGQVLKITYSKNKETVYGWKPDLKKVTNVTVYKR